ncbi:MAG TPA: type II secretion system F family protein [Jatrophihabitantaceae bacterium]|nr:type II secretion system F family protein [Jatrophihabitantaceae bacterium]
MGALLGILFGSGALLMWRSGPRRARTARSPRSAPFTRRRELLRQAGVDAVGPAQVLVVQVVCGLVAGTAVFILTAAVSVAACFFCYFFLAPVLLLRRMRRRRQVALRQQWPEAIDNLASAVRAGMSLPEALGELSVHGPVELRPPFGGFAARYRASGRFAECLDVLKDELADPVGDRICETIRVAREVGGSDVGAVLRTLSQLLRSDARTRSELETRQGWVVNAARLAVAAPWLVLLLLGTQSSTLTSFDSPGGNLLLAVGAAVCVLAYRIMLRLGRLPDEMRVVR